MARPARFDHDLILDGALRLVARDGPAAVTMDGLAAELGGNVGSLYYRFASKDLLLGRLWIRCARQGHQSFVAALDQDDLEAAFHDGVLHYPRWSRTNLAAAHVLAVVGREQLAAQWPDELGGELASVNDDVITAVRGFTRRWFGTESARHRQVVTFTLLDLPVAAIRRYLAARKEPPATLDHVVLAAARASLDSVVR